MQNHLLTIIHGPDAAARDSALLVIGANEGRQEYHMQSTLMRSSAMADFDALPTETEFHESDMLIVDSANWLLEDPKGWWKPVIDSLLGMFASRTAPLHVVLISVETMIDDHWHHLQPKGITVKVVNTGLKVTATAQD
jgi:hypothetical protein